MGRRNVTPADERDNQVIGSVLKRLRKAAGLDQADIAEALGIKQSAYSSLEAGNTTLTVQAMRTIAIRLGKTASELYADVADAGL